MIFRGIYKRIGSVELQCSAEEAVDRIRSGFRNVKVQDGAIGIDYQPTSLAFWRGRGKVQAHVLEDGTRRTVLHYEVMPALFTFDPAQLVFLIVLGGFVFVMATNTITVITALVFLLAWFLSILAAVYLAVAVLLLATVFSFISFSQYNVLALVLAWCLLLLIIHLTLRFHRKALERKFLDSLGA